MRKLIIITIVSILFFFQPEKIFGQQIAGQSASISYNLDYNDSPKKLYIKKIVIRKILDKYSSPLSSETDSFVNSCNNYNLDCYILPSITGLESFFGRYTYPNSHNPFGWGGGYTMFESWDSAIDTVGKGLRENYIDKGTETIDEIGYIYAKSPTWAVRVKYFINQFETEEKMSGLLLSRNTVE